MSDVPIVRQLMDRAFVKLRPKMNLHEAINILMAERITGAPVVDDNNVVVGLLSEKDCLHTILESAYDRVPTGTVDQYMSKLVVTIPPEMDIFQLAETFLKHPYRRLPVIQDGKIVGQITRRDLLRAIQKLRDENP